MKQLLFITIIALMAFTSCTNNEDAAKKFQVFASVSNFDGKLVKVQKRDKDNMITIDSTLVEAGKAKLTGDLSGPEMLFLSFQDVRVTVPFFAEAAEITIVVNPDSVRSAAITGSAVHQRYLDFMEEYENFDEVLYQHYQAFRSAEEVGDDSTKMAAESAYELAEKDKKQFLVKYAMDNNKDVVSHYVVYRNTYQFDLEELEAIVVNFDPETNSSYLESLYDHVLVLKSVAIGMPFADFEQGSTNDSLIKLSSRVGAKVLLVDFWASWCGPCRAENPNIVAIYNDYKDKGFDIFGVSFDTSREKWLEAIEADKLTWTHVSDLKGWSNAAGKLYGVQSIPHSVLLDANGTIIAKNLRDQELRDKIAELLN